MSTAPSLEQAIRALDTTVEAAELPAPILRQAGQLLDRLKTPVRVVFCGPANNLQQQVINQILGHDLLPDVEKRATRELHFSETVGATLTLPDGKTEKVSGHPAPEMDAAALFVSQACDLSILQEFSILDLAAGETRAALGAAIRWAAARADIAIWCSQSFTAAEQKFWTEVPRNLQDHGFLVLTGADHDGRAAALRRDPANTFQDVLAIEAATGEADELLARLRQHIALGRQDDLARATVFLRKHNLLPASQSQAPDVTSSDNSRVVPFEVARKPAAVETAEQTGGNAANQAVYRSGCAYIRDRAIELLRHDRDDGTTPGIVPYFAETIRQLSDMLDSDCDMSDAAAQSLSETLWEAEEMLVLLEIEQDGKPEEDAAGLLLQIRHEFEARLVA